MLTGILQLLYNAADHMVVGHFSSNPNAIAAVGSTNSLYNLTVNIILGLSIGSSILVAQHIGAKRYNDASFAVHTAIAFSVICGFLFMSVGLLISKPMLILMDTNEIILNDAVLYIRLICLGIPATSVYNFGAGILRSGGNSKTPLIILSLSGILNVILNLIFVICFGLDVEGVALATVISQYASAIAVICVLLKSKECYAFSFKKLRIDRISLKKILFLGVPSGIQSSLFSISNIIIQSAVNTFPLETISGNTIGGTIEGFAYTVMNSFSQAVITVVGQNHGAKKTDRMQKAIIYSILQVTVVGAIVSFTLLALTPTLVQFFINPEQGNPTLVTDAAVLRCSIILSTYFLCGIMDSLAGFMRAVGCAFVSMIVSLSGACLLRIIWVKLIFPINPVQTTLYLCYPITWGVTAITLAICCIFFIKKFKKQQGATI
jgi:putative MATE family efflux protein